MYIYEESFSSKTGVAVIMTEELLSLIRRLKSDRQLDSFDEAATKQVVILRILSLLGWDTYNIEEVEPEHLISGTKVDYLLKHANKPKVFIEAKRVAEPLEKHQEQLLQYSFKEGVNLAVLTNGITWWFYLPLNPGSWEQRKFYSIDIYDQESEEIAVRLIDYLSKDNVASGKAVDNAQALYRTRQKEYDISKTLPKAWHKVVTDPDPVLVNLIADNTEKICGFRPDSLVVKNFISTYIPLGIEDLSRAKVRPPAEAIKVSGKKPGGKTPEDVLRNATPALKDLFFLLRQEIFKLGDNVRQEVGGWYIDYRKTSTFTTITPQTKKNLLLIYIKMGDKIIDDPQKWTSPIPDSWGYGKLNTKFEVSQPNQVDYAIQLIKQAYDFVP
jgi:predicted transport protein